MGHDLRAEWNDQIAPPKAPTSRMRDTAQSDYSMLTSKTGERDGIVGGSQSTLAIDRPQMEAEQDEMELEWRKYVAAKK